MKLERPIVFLDLETTGLNTETDRIVELGIVKANVDGSREIKHSRYNPEMPIPKNVSEIHGITDEDVKDCPLFRQHVKGILAFIDGCDIAGFNSNYFDLPMFYNECQKSGYEFKYGEVNLIDVGNIFKIKEQRTLSAASIFYLNKEHVDAHSAKVDAIVTADVFFAQLEKYEDLPKTVSELALFSNYDKPILDIGGKFTTNDEGEIIFNFGKHRGEKAKEHLGFLQWMCFKASFSQDTTNIALSILNGTI